MQAASAEAHAGCGSRGIVHPMSVSRERPECDAIANLDDFDVVQVHTKVKVSRDG